MHGVFYISQYVDQGNLDGALQYTQSMIAQANMDQVGGRVWGTEGCERSACLSFATRCLLPPSSVTSVTMIVPVPFLIYLFWAVGTVAY